MTIAHVYTVNMMHTKPQYLKKKKSQVTKPITLIPSNNYCKSLLSFSTKIYIQILTYDSIMILATNRPDDNTTILRPTNRIAEVGDRITLPCTSNVNSESHWDFYAIDALKPTNIYNGQAVDVNFRRRITVDFNSCNLKTCHLTIESLRLQDAGYYVCFESSRPARKAASLTVLGQAGIQ